MCFQTILTCRGVEAGKPRSPNVEYSPTPRSVLFLRPVYMNPGCLPTRVRTPTRVNLSLVKRL